jgi:hypothetical protein
MAPQMPHAPMAQPAHQTFRASVTGVVAKPPTEADLEPIELTEAEDDNEVPPGFPKDPPAMPTPVAPANMGAMPAMPAAAPGMAPKSKIHAFSVGAGAQLANDFKRPTVNTQKGPARVRSFHGRLSEQGLDYLDHAINEWLDRHPDVDVKFVTSTVGQFDGKIKEPALILNVWY